MKQSDTTIRIIIIQGWVFRMKSISDVVCWLTCYPPLGGMFLRHVLLSLFESSLSPCFRFDLSSISVYLFCWSHHYFLNWNPAVSIHFLFRRLTLGFRWFLVFHVPHFPPLFTPLSFFDVSYMSITASNYNSECLIHKNLIPCWFLHTCANSKLFSRKDLGV